MKNQTLEELIEEFRKKFYGEMSIHDITGGYDSKPYLEAFIKKVYEAGGEAERKRIVKEYGWFTDGCGCCADTSLQNELQVKNQNDKTTG